MGYAGASLAWAPPWELPSASSTRPAKGSAEMSCTSSYLTRWTPSLQPPRCVCLCACVLVAGAEFAELLEWGECQLDWGGGGVVCHLGTSFSNEWDSSADDSELRLQYVPLMLVLVMPFSSQRPLLTSDTRGCMRLRYDPSPFPRYACSIQPAKRASSRELQKAKSFALDAPSSSGPFSYTYVCTATHDGDRVVCSD